MKEEGFKDVHQAIRMSESLLRRADLLVSKMSRDEEVRAIGRITRSSVLRLAIAQGISGLETKYGAPLPHGMDDHFLRTAQAPEDQANRQEKSDE